MAMERVQLNTTYQCLINSALLAIDDCVNRLFDAYRLTNEPDLIMNLDEMYKVRYRLEREIIESYLHG